MVLGFPMGLYTYKKSWVDWSDKHRQKISCRLFRCNWVVKTAFFRYKACFVHFTIWGERRGQRCKQSCKGRRGKTRGWTRVTRAFGLFTFAFWYICVLHAHFFASKGSPCFYRQMSTYFTIILSHTSRHIPHRHVWKDGSEHVWTYKRHCIYCTHLWKCKRSSTSKTTRTHLMRSFSAL